MSQSVEEPLLGDPLLFPTEPHHRAWSLFSLFSSHRSIRSTGRLLDRDSNFYQSNGQWNIRKRIKIKDRRALYLTSWFHSLVNSPTWKLVLILLAAYISLIFFFAILYFIIAKTFSCNMGLQNFREAFVFSLETMATIGFGTQDIFFDDCILPIVVLAAQVCMKLLTDAVVIGIIYSRVARPNTRATTIIFTDKAIIRRIRGRLYLMFQICELRKHQLVEAHVRLYVVRHNRDPVIKGQVSYFQTCAMRLNHPNDELGGMLLLCLPQTVVHEIDIWSPLYPPPLWASEHDLHRWVPPTHKEMAEERQSRRSSAVQSPGVSPPRNAGYQCEEEDMIGSEIFPAVSRRAVSGDQHPSPYAGQQSSYFQSSTPKDERAMIQKYIKDRKIEIVAIVEGYDATTGGAVQSRHSYTVDEVLWDHAFARCVFEEPGPGTAVIDFSKFHETVPAPADAEYTGIMPSQV